MRIDVYIHSQDEASSLGRILDAINHMEKTIMTAISDFAAQQSAFNADVSSDLAAIKTSIDALNAQIATLQNSPGTISPEDQATLDSLQAAGQALATQADTLAGKTPPVVPTA